MGTSKAHEVRALEWLDGLPDGGLSADLAVILGTTQDRASEALRILGVAGKVVWQPAPAPHKGKRKRYFSLRHKPPLIGATLARTARSKAALRLDAEAPAESLKDVEVTRWQPPAPVDARPTPAIFASLQIGSYLSGGWSESVYGTPR